MRAAASGRSPWHIVSFATAVMLGALACSNSLPLTATAQPILSGPPPSSTVLTCPKCESRTVSRVIDGDTLDLTDSTRVRVFGIDTPERGKRCFAEATERLGQLADGTVRLEDGSRLRDAYGRRLAYLYTADGLSIDVLMIGEGLAEAWTRDGQHRNTLMALEESARENRIGCLWGGLSDNPVSGDPPDGQYDSSGPDLDCADFKTQAEAQAFYQAAGGSGTDPHRLDGDNDTIACETLP